MIIIYDFDILNLKAKGIEKETKRELNFTISIKDSKIKFYCIEFLRELRDSEWIFEKYDLYKKHCGVV